MLVSLVLSELTNSFSKHLPAYLIRSLSHCFVQNCYLSQFNFNVNSMNSCIHKTQIKGFAASFTNTRFKKPVQHKWKNSCKPNTYYISSRIWILLLFFQIRKYHWFYLWKDPVHQSSLENQQYCTESNLPEISSDWVETFHNIFCFRHLATTLSYPAM